MALTSVQKVAIVAAGGSGMGAAAAAELARGGFKVAILSSSGKGEALAGQLGGLGVTGSNQSNEDLKRLVDETVREWGRVDVLVNSAGHGPRAPILDLRQQAGVIINISTFAAFEPDPAFPTSSVFRAGLASFAKIYADNYAAYNIRMNNLLPGFIDSFPEKAELRQRIPLKRYGKVEEIAATIAFLASDAAAYISGQNIRIDGGITRSV